MKNIFEIIVQSYLMPGNENMSSLSKIANPASKRHQLDPPFNHN